MYEAYPPDTENQHTTEVFVAAEEDSGNKATLIRPFEVVISFRNQYRVLYTRYVRSKLHVAVPYERFRMYRWRTETPQKHTRAVKFISFKGSNDTS